MEDIKKSTENTQSEITLHVSYFEMNKGDYNEDYIVCRAGEFFLITRIIDDPEFYDHIRSLAVQADFSKIQIHNSVPNRLKWLIFFEEGNSNPEQWYLDRWNKSFTQRQKECFTDTIDSLSKAFVDMIKKESDNPNFL